MSYTTALYLRLSVDDGDKQNESDSIANQRALLLAYVNADAALSVGEVLVFADDGWSGTSFERPQVKALLELASRGGVQCVIVRDLSRWGRSYPDVSEYVDRYFPLLGIRFISVAEGYDSDRHRGRTAPPDVAFGSIIHDIYCKELSFKVRQSYQAKTKNGEFLSGSPPFGYIKSDENKNRLVVDREAADTVLRIFTMACEGYTGAEIAAALNEACADTPLMYRKRKGYTLRGAHKTAGDRIYWTGSSVLKIIRDERYAGVMVGSKARKVSPGSRKTARLPESEWIRVPGSHQAIVTAEIFQKANEIILRRTTCSFDNSRIC
jgi:DNA invertase Pin-like site-specific DNA recombinase